MAAPDEPIFGPFSRRTLLTMGLGAFLVSTLPRATKVLSRRRFTRTVPVMGTIAEISAVDSDPRRANAALDAASAELVRLDRLLTRFDDASDVGRVNAGAAAGPVPVSEETARVVEEALRWAEASDGAFDPCLERPIDVWDVLHRTEPPAPALYRRYAGRRLYARVDVSRGSSGPAIRFSDADVGLDLGGIAKGYAVDRAADAMRALGVKDALVKAGGDLVALGRSERDEPWRIGIRDPSSPDGIVSSFDLSDGAAATSGDYERFFDFGGRRYHHILDPGTAAPKETRFHGVTVTASTCMDADASATAAFGRAKESADALLSLRGRGSRVVAVV